MVALSLTKSASGARYSGAAASGSYIWWTKGETARLSWSAAAGGAETRVLSECKEVPGPPVD